MTVPVNQTWRVYKKETVEVCVIVRQISQIGPNQRVGIQHIVAGGRGLVNFNDSRIDFRLRSMSDSRLEDVFFSVPFICSDSTFPIVIQ